MIDDWWNNVQLQKQLTSTHRNCINTTFYQILQQLFKQFIVFFTLFWPLRDTVSWIHFKPMTLLIQHKSGRLSTPTKTACIACLINCLTPWLKSMRLGQLVEIRWKTKTQHTYIVVSFGEGSKGHFGTVGMCGAFDHNDNAKLHNFIVEHIRWYTICRLLI